MHPKPRQPPKRKHPSWPHAAVRKTTRAPWTTLLRDGMASTLAPTNVSAGSALHRKGTHPPPSAAEGARSAWHPPNRGLKCRSTIGRSTRPTSTPDAGVRKGTLSGRRYRGRRSLSLIDVAVAANVYGVGLALVASGGVADEEVPEEFEPADRRRRRLERAFTRGRRRGRRGGDEGSGGLGVREPRRPRPGGEADGAEAEPEDSGE
jgi:hypothetical protein